MILTDAGPLVAILDRGEEHHQACVDCLDHLPGPMLTTWPAFTEAMYLLGDAGGHRLAGVNIQTSLYWCALRRFPKTLLDAISKLLDCFLAHPDHCYLLRVLKDDKRGDVQYGPAGNQFDVRCVFDVHRVKVRRGLETLNGFSQLLGQLVVVSIPTRPAVNGHKARAGQCPWKLGSG